MPGWKNSQPAKVHTPTLTYVSTHAQDLHTVHTERSTHKACGTAHLQEEEHGDDLEGGVNLTNGLDLVPFISYKVRSPDADCRCWGLSFTTP